MNISYRFFLCLCFASFSVALKEVLAIISFSFFLLPNLLLTYCSQTLLSLSVSYSLLVLHFPFLIMINPISSSLFRPFSRLFSLLAFLASKLDLGLLSLLLQYTTYGMNRFRKTTAIRYTVIRPIAVRPTLIRFFFGFHFLSGLGQNTLRL